MKKYIFALMFFLIPIVSLACTDFRLNAKDGTTMIARSMEFTTDLYSNLRTSNRQRVFQTIAPDGKPGLFWQSKYGYLFFDGLGVDRAIDGINEKGLSIEALYLPIETTYQTVPPGQDAQALGYTFFGDWVLSNFETVDQVRQALGRVFVFPVKIPSFGDKIFPFHYAIHDASGKSIVIEFINGQMHIYNNVLGVLTNSPPYDWQIVNLRNYLNLSPMIPNPTRIGDMLFLVTGGGAGMHGLPGDPTPPSRFVKIALMKNSAYQAKDASEALNLAQHILNNVDIPKGFMRASQGNKIVTDYTQWVTFKDLTHKVLYYRTYQDTTLHAINLLQLDFSKDTPRLKMPILDNQFIIDTTKQLKNSTVS